MFIITKRHRRKLAPLIRYTVCAAAVTWLIVHTDWEELKRVLVSANWRLVVVSILAYGPCPVFLSLRLKWLLHVHDIHLSVWQALKVTFGGNFIITTLPVGTSGGDAVKAYYVARETPRKHEAVTTVFFDRVIGVVGLVGLAGVVLLLDWDNPAFVGWGRLISLLVVMLLAGGGIYYSQTMRGLLRLDQIVSYLPMSHHLQRIDRAFFAFRHRFRRVAFCLGATVALQVVAIVSLFLAGWALGMVGDSPWKALPVYLAYTPICFLASALPIGVMEEMFNQLFVDAGQLGPREGAYALSLLSRFIQLMWALPGALVVLKAGRPREALEELKIEFPDHGGPEADSGVRQVTSAEWSECANDTA